MDSRITNLRLLNTLNNIIQKQFIPWISVVLIANELIANLSTCYLSMILIIQSHKINYLQFGKVSRALDRTNWNYRAINWLKKALKKHCTQKFRAGINQLSRKQKRRQENSQRNDSSNNNNKYLYETSFFCTYPTQTADTLPLLASLAATRLCLQFQFQLMCPTPVLSPRHITGVCVPCVCRVCVCVVWVWVFVEAC